MLVTDLKELIEQLRELTSSIAELSKQRALLLAEVETITDSHDLEILEEATNEDDLESYNLASDIKSIRLLKLTDGSRTEPEKEGTVLSETTFVTAPTHIPQQLIDLPQSDSSVSPAQASNVEQEGTKGDVVESSGFAFFEQNKLKYIQEQDKAYLNETHPDGKSYGPMSRKVVVAQLRKLFERNEPLISARIEGYYTFGGSDDWVFLLSL